MAFCGKATVASLLFVLGYLTLVKGQCYTNEDGGPSHCCDQRGNDGPLVCCEGQNSSCSVENPVEGSECFCDEFCKEAGDCCPDVEQAREECSLEGPRDCVVEPWGRWSLCSHQCGVGVSKRTRKIVTRNTKGGKECPPLREKKGCFKTHCGGKEIGLAHILPNRYKSGRYRSEYEKILPAPKVLPTTAKPKRPSYCVTFKIMYRHPYCNNSWGEELDPKRPICVECEDWSMNGEGRCKGTGILGGITLWEAVDLYSCYGAWLKIGPRMPHCQCNNKHFNNFLFI